MAKSKTIRRIMSPEEMRAGDAILASRAKQEAIAKDDVAKNNALLSPDGGADVTNAAQQSGRAMPRETFISRIRKLNPALRYEQSNLYPKQGGIYFVGNREPVDGSGGVEFGKWFICGIPHDHIGEFDTRLVKPELIPSPGHQVAFETLRRVDGLTRGWRSALLKLMQDGLLSPGQIDREFQITRGRSSQKWQEAMTN